MKTYDNINGFRAAMTAGKPWTVLECTVTKRESTDDCYWEIEKTVFCTNKNKSEGVTETVAHGFDITKRSTVKKIWNNLIEKYNPDEYFVDEFQLVVPPDLADNNCMMNEKKDEKALSQIMEEMAVDWKEFADCMPTSYEVYDDGRDEDVN